MANLDLLMQFCYRFVHSFFFDQKKTEMMCWLNQKKLTLLAGCGIRSTRLIFKTELLVYQAKANLDVKFFGKITHLLYQTMRKMLVRSLCGLENSTFHAGT